MKRIGMIAGLSWQSSLEYYRIINELVAERLGGYHSADIAMRSLDLGDIEPLLSAGDWPGVAGYVIDAGLELEASGADFLMICSNTIHKVADDLEGAVELPVVHIADATAEVIKSAGMSRVGLIGTRFTMSEDFYRDHLAQLSISTITPEYRDAQEIDRIIFDELTRGDLRSESRDFCYGVAAGLVMIGAQGIILGCTELPILFNGAAKTSGEYQGIRVFDTMHIHARAAVEYALKED